MGTLISDWIPILRRVAETKSLNRGGLTLPWTIGDIVKEVQESVDKTI